jgi:hypothetical protein
MQEKLREMQDKRRQIIEETIRRDFEEKERNDTQHRSQNIGDEGRQGSYESEKMAYKNPTVILLMTNTFLTHIPHVCSEHV